MGRDENIPRLDQVPESDQIETMGNNRPSVNNMATGKLDALLCRVAI